MENLIEEAIRLAMNAHRGQTDKAGLPYILHPLRVMSRFVSPDDDEARTVAVLHDVVEDTGVTLALLRQWNYPESVVEAIDAISKRNGEEYEDYIRRVARNQLARRVKLADLWDNLDPRRASTGMLHPDTVRKYRKAEEDLWLGKWSEVKVAEPGA